MDDKLTAKTAKFTSLENLYVYGIQHLAMCVTNIYMNVCKITTSI